MVVALFFGATGKSPQAIALGAILILALHTFWQGTWRTRPRVLTQRTPPFSVAAAVGYFTLQNGAEWLMNGILFATPAPFP
jgi:NAD(P)H-quinone oxidoreductase subunit 5